MNENMTFEQRIGSRIAALRRMTGVRQRELADFLHVTVSTVSHYESGIHMPQPAVLVRIAEFFGVSADYILGQTDLRISGRDSHRQIALSDGEIVSLEEIGNRLFALSEKNQAEICRMINLYRLEETLHQGPSDGETTGKGPDSLKIAPVSDEKA